MLNYLRSLLCLFYMSIAIFGIKRHLIVVCIGAIAKISLLLSFLITIKLMVWMLKITSGEVFFSYLGVALKTETITTCVFLFIPASLFISGLFVYYGQKLTISLVSDFTNEVRSIHYKAVFHEFSCKNKKECKDFVGEFLNSQAPDMKKASKILLNGVIELVQSISIIIIVFLGLSFHDLFVSVVALGAMAAVIPVYVKRNNIVYSKFKKERELLNAKLQEEKSRVINCESVAAGELSAIKNEVESFLFSSLGERQLEIDNTRALSSRKTFPYIYGILGFMFSYMFYSLLSPGLPVASNMLGDFVVSVFALRFLASSLNSLLNALRQINLEYPSLKQVNKVLKEVVPKIRPVR